MAEMRRRSRPDMRAAIKSRASGVRYARCREGALRGPDATPREKSPRVGGTHCWRVSLRGPMATVVAIDVPADLPPVVAQAAVTECRNALGSERCIASQAKHTIIPDWYAIIRSDAVKQGRLRIEFRRSAPSGELVAQRILSFSERDPERSRWVSAELVVAALLAAEDATTKPSPMDVPPTRDVAPLAPDRHALG